MSRLAGLTLAALLLTVPAAQASDPDTGGLLRSLAITRTADHRWALSVWLPPVALRTILAQGGNLPALQIDSVMEGSADYQLFMVAARNEAQLQEPGFVSSDELRRTVTIEDRDGHPIRPLKEDAIPSLMAEFLSGFVKQFANATGFKGVTLLAFPTKDNEGRPLIDTDRQGLMVVHVGATLMCHRTPPGSAPLGAVDPKTGGSLSGSPRLAGCTGDARPSRPADTTAAAPAPAPTKNMAVRRRYVMLDSYLVCMAGVRKAPGDRSWMARCMSTGAAHVDGLPALFPKCYATGTLDLPCSIKESGLPQDYDKKGAAAYAACEALWVDAAGTNEFFGAVPGGDKLLTCLAEHAGIDWITTTPAVMPAQQWTVAGTSPDHTEVAFLDRAITKNADGSLTTEIAVSMGDATIELEIDLQIHGLTLQDLARPGPILSSAVNAYIDAGRIQSSPLRVNCTTDSAVRDGKWVKIPLDSMISGLKALICAKG
jgi:hypothetical protein